MSSHFISLRKDLIYVKYGVTKSMQSREVILCPFEKGTTCVFEYFGRGGVGFKKMGFTWAP